MIDLYDDTRTRDAMCEQIAKRVHTHERNLSLPVGHMSARFLRTRGESADAD